MLITPSTLLATPPSDEAQAAEAPPIEVLSMAPSVNAGHPPKLPHGVIVSAPGLLPMLYTLSELEDELGISARRIREWLDKGAPYQRDARGHLWVNGESFADWVQRVQATRNKSKVKLRENEAYCLRCNKAVPLNNPVEIRTGKLIRWQGQCPGCNTTINKGARHG